MKTYDQKTSKLLDMCQSDSEETGISRLFSVCAGMDEISGSSEDFFNLLRENGEDALEDEELSLAAGGIKPIAPPKH